MDTDNMDWGVKVGPPDNRVVEFHSNKRVVWKLTGWKARLLVWSMMGAVTLCGVWLAVAIVLGSLDIVRLVTTQPG